MFEGPASAKLVECLEPPPVPNPVRNGLNGRTGAGCLNGVISLVRGERLKRARSLPISVLIRYNYARQITSPWGRQR